MWVMLEILYDYAWRLAMMDLARSLGRIWCVDPARSFMIMHEDQP